MAYNNLVMFNQEGFTAFRSRIKKIKEDQPGRRSPAAHFIMIPAPGQGIRLWLSANELNDLAEMPEAVDTEWQSLHLFNLFNSQTS